MIKRTTLAIIMAVSIMFSSSVNIGFAEENSNVETENTEVVDTIAPTISVLNPVWDSHTKVSGKTETGAIVIAEINSAQYAGNVDENGNFSVDINTKRVAGTKIKIIVKDEAGNSSEKDITVIDKTAPNVPVVNSVWDSHVRVSGKTEPNITVIVQIDKSQYTGTSDKNGNFNVDIKSKTKAGSKVKIIAKDQSGNSSYKDIVVIDKTAPNVPVVNSVWDIHTRVSGKTEPSITVIVQIDKSQYTGTSDKNGNFNVDIKSKRKAGTKVKIIAKDSAGNSSYKDIVVIDKTAPNVPVVNAIWDNHTKITGKAEPGSTVIVKAGSKQLGKVKVDNKGGFSVTISKQKYNTILSINSIDPSGNMSKGTTVKVKGRLDIRKANRSIYLKSGRKKVTIPKGASITVQSSVADRCLVTYKGVTGYVSSRHLNSGLDYSKFNKNIDAFMNENYIKSDTKYVVITSLQKKETYVFKGSVGNWKRIKTWKCTIGKPSTPTITGEYEVGIRGRSFGQNKGYQCKWYTQISGNYLYHSVIYNKVGTRITDGRLGSALSHGCIRLATENAKWIYDNVSKNTKVIVK